MFVTINAELLGVAKIQNKIYILEKILFVAVNVFAANPIDWRNLGSVIFADPRGQLESV